MSRVVLTGGGELDPGSPAGQVLAGQNSVAVVTVAASFSRPVAISEKVHQWADVLGITPVFAAAVRRAAALEPSSVEPILSADSVLVLDGSPAHFVATMKATPMLAAIVEGPSRGADVVWSGAAAMAVCNPMVDDRGGALTVGLGVYPGIVVAGQWERWPNDRRRRLRQMIPGDATFVALDTGAAVASTDGVWSVLGGQVEAEHGGEPLELPLA